MHCVAPRGYAAYARVFHPATRDRPAASGSWRRQDRSAFVDVETETVPWSALAQAFGTSMHAVAQHHLLPGPASEPYGEVLDAEGWRYSEPLQGNLDLGVLATLASRLCRHTSTPGKGVAAIWEGWGGLTSSAGYSQLTFHSDGAGTPLTTTPAGGRRSRLGAAAGECGERPEAGASRPQPLPLRRSPIRIHRASLGTGRAVAP